MCEKYKIMGKKVIRIYCRTFRQNLYKHINVLKAVMSIELLILSFVSAWHCEWIRNIAVFMCTADVYTFCCSSRPWLMYVAGVVSVSRRCCSLYTESGRGPGRSRSPPATRSSDNTWSTAGATAAPQKKRTSHLQTLRDTNTPHEQLMKECLTGGGTFNNSLAPWRK